MIDLKDLQTNSIVYYNSDNGPHTSSMERVIGIILYYDKKTKETYKVIVLSKNRQFDSRNGKAITPPLSYNIKAFVMDAWP